MIHVVDYVNTRLRHVDHWRTLIPNLLSMSGYDVSIISGTDSIPGDDVLMGETLYKSIQYTNLYNSIISGNVSPKDIIIFADAWNPMAISFRFLCTHLRLKVKLVGVWRGGLYDINSLRWKSMWGQSKRWASTFERTLYNLYDVNCFFDDDSRRRFLNRYSIQSSEKAFVTGYPCGDITVSSIGQKQNIIVVPHDAVTSEQRDIVLALQAYLTEFEFVNCQELRLTREDYYNVLSNAKAVLAVNLYESDPISIYEGMVFGCVPIVPNISIYSTVFPEYYHYPSHYVQPPFLNFVRGREFMYNRIRDVVYNYEMMLDTLVTDTTQVMSTYYNNQQFLNILEKL